MPNESVILYACNSRLVVDFVEVCHKNGIEIRSIINNQPGTHNQEVEWVEAGSYDFEGEQAPFLVPLFTPSNRFLASREALGHNLTPYPLLSDRNNDLPLQFEHGAGCFINKGVLIGAASTLGDFVLINRGACLGHHMEMEDFVSIGPGAVTGGDVRLGRGALVGTGAIIRPGVTVGRHAVVGAGAVVVKDVPDQAVVIGNPAREIKRNVDVF